MFRSKAFKTISLVAAASGAYVLSSYQSGNLSTAPFRSYDYVQHEMENFSGIKKLRSDANYAELSHKLAVSTIPSRQGAVSEAVLSFRSQEDPHRVVSFVYCGPLSVGFPHMVHGGVIATILRQTAQTALGCPDKGHLEIKYLKPTKIDQILRVETKSQPDGVLLQLFSQDESKPLVEATYTFQ